MEKGTLKINRILAALTDGFFMLLIFVGITIAPALSFFTSLNSGKFIVNDFVWLIISIFSSFVIWILYLFIFTFIFKNATLGMKLNGLNFVNTKDNEITYSSLLFRETSVVLCLVFSLGLSIFADLFSVIFSKGSRDFIDILSSLRVVNSNAN